VRERDYLKILLMEDDTLLGETLQEMLSEAGHDTRWVMDGKDAAESSFSERYDLYIFDINVPEINGFDLVASLRDADDQTPAIFISAMGDLAAIAKGFAVGADDYLKKPFFPEELLLRIDAKYSPKSHLIEYGGILYNALNHEVNRNGKLLVLGDVQLSLLSLFITNIGRTLSKESLLDLMEHPSDSALRVAINKLKHTTGWDIHNIRGVGYRIEKS
jgi:DNA-binding response OmpR family regulator